MIQTLYEQVKKPTSDTPEKLEKSLVYLKPKFESRFPMKLRTALLVILLFLSIFSSAQTDPVGSGRAIQFDGIDDYINLGNIYDDLTLPITVSAWVYLENPQGYLNPIFISQDNQDIYNGFWFTVSTTAVDMEIGDGMGHDSPEFRRGKTATVNIGLHQWYHICGVMRSPTDVDLYVNGINVGGTHSGWSTLPMNSNFPSDEAKIGAYFTNGISYPFKGSIDDVRVYNIALTQAQIRETMCKKLNGNETGLIGNWDFNETTGTSVIDKSSNGFNGTLINGTARVYSGAPIGDESVYLYPGNWSSAELTMNEAGHEVSVSGVSSNTSGVHIYAVRSLPSRTMGIDLGTALPPYFGVFIADIPSGRTFDLQYATVCELAFREDNSVASWGEGVIENVLNRQEFIRQAEAPESISISLGPDMELCPFTPKVLTPTVNPSGYTFLWQDGSTGSTYTPAMYGTYWVDVWNGCASDRYTIRFTKKEVEFTIDLGEDLTICPLSPIVLTPMQNPLGYSFEWQDGSMQSTFVINDYGEYTVTVYGECGTASDTIRVSRPEFTELFIPNVITPNNDSYNETFIVAEDLRGGDLEIFDRWGKKVYHTYNYQNNWSADGLQAGIYFYTIRTTCLEDKKGWISVVR
jgi:gliding motility-associated-like protein